LRHVPLVVLIALLASCASKPPAPTVGGTTPPPAVRSGDTKSQRCVALAMYWEARGEGREGMLAVGSVVLNRVHDQRFPNSVCGVVYQGGETPPCQFSWWCDGKSDRPTDGALWATSLDLAGELLTARPRDPTHGALYFHNTAIRSPWRKTRTATIGNHVFYR